MKKEIEVKAPAKINLFLDILARRNDGYHNILTYMQTVSLYDTVRISQSDSDRVSVAGYGIDTPQDKNIAFKAAELFLSELRSNDHFNIEIIKNIPVMAGMGGGSADAAAVIYGLNEVYGRPYDTDRLISFGAMLGADVAFMQKGGMCKATGVGDILEPLPTIQNDLFVLLAKPEFGFSTPAMYKEFDSVDNPIHGNEKAFLLENTRFLNLFNSFEQTNSFLKVATIKQTMLNYGAVGSLLSGSGSTVFGIFNNEEKALSCKKGLASLCNFTHLCVPVSKGPETV